MARRTGTEHIGRVAVALGIALVATHLLAACTTSSGAPGGGGVDFDSGAFDATFNEDGGTDATSSTPTLAACLGGVVGEAPPSACVPFIDCVEATDGGCGGDLSTCFGPGWMSGDIAGACASFESCATQNACTPAAGVSCFQQSGSGCQGCIDGLLSCIATSCASSFYACKNGLLSGLVDGGTMPMPDSGAADSGEADSTTTDSSVVDSSTVDSAVVDSALPEAAIEAAAPEAGPPDGSIDSGIVSFGAITGVTVGDGTACGLTAAGGVVCWGDNGFGQLGNNSLNPSVDPVQVTGLTAGVTSLSAGSSYSACAVASGGAVMCWGANGDGQLGNGTTTASSVPVQVTGLTSGATSVSVGTNSACAVTAGGGVMCWGDNTFGELGNGTTTSSQVPVQVSGLTSGVTSVSVGEFDTCALTSGGGVQCWGYNGNGQLGNGTTTPSSVPVQVTGLTSGATSLAVGLYSTCAVASGGAVMCWGLDTSGDLGNGDASVAGSLVPYPVAGLGSGATSVSTSQYSVCALMAGGGVVCWGDNSYGTLGNGTTTDSSYPVQVTGITVGASAVSVGFQSVCAVFECGVQCWGVTALGNSSTSSSTVPVPVDDVGASSCAAWFGAATSVSVGADSACAVTASGGVVCWGNNGSGDLGDGTGAERLQPVQVVGLTSGVSQVAMANDSEFACALTAGGGVMCWGDNTDGELGNGSAVAESLVPVQVTGLTNGVTRITTGASFACAVNAAGGVVCWGNNSEGELGNGTTTNSSVPVPVTGLTTGVVSVSAGNTGACAITTSGVVVCWGSEDTLGNGSMPVGGYTPDPVQVTGLTSGVASVSVGTDDVCAVTTAGVLWCWGIGDYGQLGNGMTGASFVPVQASSLMSTATAVAAGFYPTCVVTTAGGVLCWGYGADGELGNGTTPFDSLTPVQVTGLTSGVTSLSAGQVSACAVVDCGVVCWGSNGSGELGNGTTTSSSVPIQVSLLGATTCP